MVNFNVRTIFAFSGLIVFGKYQKSNHPKALFRAITRGRGLRCYQICKNPRRTPGNGHHYIRHEIHAGRNGILTLSSFNKLIR